MLHILTGYTIYYGWLGQSQKLSPEKGIFKEKDMHEDQIPSLVYRIK